MKEKLTIRFYPNLIKAAVEALERIFQKKEMAGRVVEEVLKSNKKWGARDRRFIAESVYEIVRWYRLLYEIAGGEPKNAADWWKLFGILQIIKDTNLPEWKEFEGLEVESIIARHAELKEIRKIRESIPDWLDELVEKEIGADKWTAIIKALNEPAILVLRANTLKTTPKKLIADLEKEAIESKLGKGDSLVLLKRRKLQNTTAFRKGHFEVQDFGSQQIAPYLEASKGMKVIDACAGAGGKSLHLAALMQNEGEIIALDIHAKKLRELEKRVRRNGVEIVKSKKVSSPKVIEELHDTADRLLLDMPCTGLGTLRRKPDSKWKLKAEDLKRYQVIQADLLTRYSKMLKVGGKMVYATCSILPSENEKQVAGFIEQEKGGFTLCKEQYISPVDGFDGFYMAQIERIN